MRRFDEVISEKASKMDLRVVNKTVQTYVKGTEFQHSVSDLTSRIQSGVERMREVEYMIDTMGRNISKDIYAAVRRATSNLVKKADGNGSVTGEGSGMISNDMKVAMIAKADKSDVESLV